MRKFRYIYCAVAVLFSSTIVVAQNEEEEVYNENVVVISGYQPVLQKTERINVVHRITDTANMKVDFNYKVYPHRLFSLYAPERINAARLVGEPSAKLYKSYIKLGMGNYMSPLADLYFNSLKNKSLNYSARVYHNSSWWSLKDYGSNWYSNTDVDLFGKYMWKNKVLSANVFYNNDYNLYYGFTDSTLNTIYPNLNRDDLEKSDYSQVYNYVGANVDFRTSNKKIEDLYYQVALGIYNFSDHYASNEFCFKMNADLHYGFAWFGNEKEILGMQVAWDLYSNTVDTMIYPYAFKGISSIDSIKEKEHLLKIHPYFKFKLYGFDLDAGLNVFVSTSNKVKLKPHIILSQDFSDETLHFSIGAVGDAIRNGWQNLRIENPYVAPHTETATTYTNKYFLEGKFALMNNLDLGLALAYQTFTNAPVFMIDTNYALGNVYSPIYIDYDMLQVGFNSKYRLSENLGLAFSANYYRYFLPEKSPIQEMLYKPNFDLDLGAFYSYNDKIIVSLNTILLGKMNGLNIENNEYVYEKMPIKYGIDLNVEYRYTKALSFFATFDNVAFQRYFYWTNYPSQKFRVMFGLTYTIPSL
ncbi:MAG: hypothetical protein IKJ67_06210 [Bacteroidales bacterium]|nr:hypothetical protein [Bacteroidales bacterium]